MANEHIGYGRWNTGQTNQDMEHVQRSSLAKSRRQIPSLSHSLVEKLSRNRLESRLPTKPAHNMEISRDDQSVRLVGPFEPRSWHDHGARRGHIGKCGRRRDSTLLEVFRNGRKAQAQQRDAQ